LDLWVDFWACLSGFHFMEPFVALLIGFFRIFEKDEEKSSSHT